MKWRFHSKVCCDFVYFVCMAPGWFEVQQGQAVILNGSVHINLCLIVCDFMHCVNQTIVRRSNCRGFVYSRAFILFNHNPVRCVFIFSSTLDSVLTVWLHWRFGCSYVDIMFTTCVLRFQYEVTSKGGSQMVVKWHWRGQSVRHPRTRLHLGCCNVVERSIQSHTAVMIKGW